MTTVIGIDPSLRSTGLARITYNAGRWCAETAVRESTGRRGDSIAVRHERVCGIAADAIAFAEPCDLVCIEDAIFGAQGGSTVDRAYLWWRIVGRLLDHETPVVIVNSSTRKLFATGRGGTSADKAAVAHSVTRMWPDWEGGNADAADALAIASVGVCLLGLPVLFDMPGYRRDALAKVTVPDVLEGLNG